MDQTRLQGINTQYNALYWEATGTEKYEYGIAYRIEDINVMVRDVYVGDELIYTGLPSNVAIAFVSARTDIPDLLAALADAQADAESERKRADEYHAGYERLEKEVERLNGLVIRYDAQLVVSYNAENAARAEAERLNAEVATLEYMIGERDTGWKLANNEIERLKMKIAELHINHIHEVIKAKAMPTPADDARLEAALTPMVDLHFPPRPEDE